MKSPYILLFIITFWAFSLLNAQENTTYPENVNKLLNAYPPEWITGYDGGKSINERRK